MELAISPVEFLKLIPTTDKAIRFKEYLEQCLRQYPITYDEEIEFIFFIIINKVNLPMNTFKMTVEVFDIPVKTTEKALYTCRFCPNYKTTGDSATHIITLATPTTCNEVYSCDKHLKRVIMDQVIKKVYK